MKKLLLLFLFSILFLYSPKEVKADCGNFFINPASANEGAAFTVNLFDCDFPFMGNYYVDIMDENNNQVRRVASFTNVSATQAVATIPAGVFDPGDYTALLYERTTLLGNSTFTVRSGGAPPPPAPQPQDPGGTASRVSEGCDNQNYINTAIGCIPINDVNALTRFFLGWALGIAGGIALLMIGFAGYRIATSQGDPRRLQGGQELLMSAIGGLLMVVLSVYLLRFIGVDLLGIF